MNFPLNKFISWPTAPSSFSPGSKHNVGLAWLNSAFCVPFQPTAFQNEDLDQLPAKCPLKFTSGATFLVPKSAVWVIFLLCCTVAMKFQRHCVPSNQVTQSCLWGKESVLLLTETSLRNMNGNKWIHLYFFPTFHAMVWITVSQNATAEDSVVVWAPPEGRYLDKKVDLCGGILSGSDWWPNVEPDTE